jgi:oligopeptidase B
LKQQKVLGGFKASDYRSELLYAKAKDGTLIPVSLVVKKSTPISARTPLLLYGYGSYGSSTDPWFSNSMISLLDRGMIFAVAHVRGGGEMGTEWYDRGKLQYKMNTFTDFIACADMLCEEKYTSHERMAMRGGRAGGDRTQEAGARHKSSPNRTDPQRHTFRRNPKKRGLSVHR